jgi:hypothetical protein
MSKPLDAHQKHVAHLHQLHLKHLAHLAQQGHGAQHTKKQVPKQTSAKQKSAAAAKGAAVKGHGVAKAKGRTAKRALALNNDLGCCVAEAVSASIRLSGFPAIDENILNLFWRAGGDPDSGIAIPDMLMTTSESELVSCQLGKLIPLDPDATDPMISNIILGLNLPSPHAVFATPDGWWSWGSLFSPYDFPDAVIEEAWEISWR